MKKLLSVIVVIFLVFPSFCGVLAEKERDLPSGTVKVEMPTGGFLPCPKMPIDELNISRAPKRRGAPSRTAENEDESENVYQFIESQLRQKAEYIELYPDYLIEIDIFFDEETGKVRDADLTNFWEVLCTVLFNNYDILAYVGCEDFRYGEEEDGKCYAYSFVPKYINPTEGDEAAVSMMNNEIDKYLEAASEIPDSDVVGKMLVIHDLFCEKNTYAYEEHNAYEELKRLRLLGEIEDFDEAEYLKIYTAYGLFKNNRAVCQGNAIALKAIYDKLNEQLAEGSTIKTGLCASDNINHIWNVVKIDGDWYHIDETWDDPVFLVSKGESEEEEEYEVFIKKYASHNNFLKSYDAMSNHIEDGIDDWVYYADEEVLCNSKKYESGYIFNFVPEEYYVYNEETGEGKKDTAGQLIAYKDGRYRLEVEDLGEEYPFWAESICATKALATDVYENKNGESEILLFVNNDIDAYRISAKYDAYGILTDCIKDSESLKGGIFNPVLAESSYSHMFIWSKNNFEPLCRVIDIH